MKKIILFFLLSIVIFSCKKNDSKVVAKINEVKADSVFIKVSKPKTKINEIPISQIQKLMFSDNTFVRGLYLSAYTVASKNFIKILEKSEKAKINTIVFDLKNMNGHVFYKSPSLASYGREKVIPIINIPKLVKTLHKRDMKAVARVVMFHDMYLAKNDTTLCASKKDGTVWRESYKKVPSWLDPSDERNQIRLLKIIDEIARQGVDEIQLDYIRFPTGGNLSQANFDFNSEDANMSEKDSLYVKRNKYDIISKFVSKAKTICDKYEVSLAADVFAIVSWQNTNDVRNTGQRLSLISENLTYLHPMLYSSHFANNFNYRNNVWNEPYDILFKGTSLAIKNSDKKCKVIPYIQANGWKVNYIDDYIYSQIAAIYDASGEGFLLWNAQNKYDKVLDWLIKINGCDTAIY